MAPVVSIIIPVWNRPDLVRDAIHSAISQTYSAIEIIVVNDGSTDRTQFVLEELLRKYSPTLKVIHVPNGGVGLAREHGRKTCTGTYIQYLDSDDVLWPRKLEIQVAALEANPDCGIAYGKTRLVSADGTVIAAPFKRSGERFEYLFPILLVDRWWNTLTPLYRRSVCEAIGPWSDMRMSEDWEYESRAAGLKTKLIFCDEYVADVREHNTGRLTGGGTPHEVVLRNTARLISSLYENAIKAGIDRKCPEFLHFSRWAFSVARTLATDAASDEAWEILQIADACRVSPWQSIDQRCYQLLSRLLGIQRTASLFLILRKLLPRLASDKTMKQSWMQQ